MTSQTAATGTTQTLDDAVFDAAEPLADEWSNGSGKRFYRLADPIGNNKAVFALTQYERAIDDETGETVETETLENIGHLDVNISLRNAERNIWERLEEDAEFWERTLVETLQHEFENYFNKRVPSLFADVSRDGDGLVDIYLQKEIRIGINKGHEAEYLWDRSGGSETEWQAFLWAVAEETTYIDIVNDDSLLEDAAYAVIPDFEPAPEWRLRAIENYYCGVFRNSPALANVAALLDSDAVSTQAEIATKLDKDESTVSQQVADVRDWQKRIGWTCKNR